ncbi:MAG: hypothetical protein IT306_07610 [Chloroflexi bacterium]|nr:hypothetical protein [Chloroflexota bacterium]
MKIGDAGDSLSLVRVILAMLVGGLVLGVVGYGFDRAIGPMIAMNGWWTVFASGGFILGGMLQAAREFGDPQPAERRVMAARTRAREAAESAAEKASEPSKADAEQPSAPVGE